MKCGSGDPAKHCLNLPKRCLRAMRWLPAMAIALLGTVAFAQNKPNILVIWGDDVGYWNLSAYNQGMMGYQTPNIDRIAKEGALFTDTYAQQSCTAGRSAFITGQHPIRTGLLKVGLPGAKQGLFAEDPTLAELLKPHGYATAQIGKNHLGDRNEFLPTVHGFDEFFGNLYHLNAEEEAEDPHYPKDPEFAARFGTRGVLDCKASDKDDRTEDPRFGRMGKQVCHGHRSAHQETHGNGGKTNCSPTRSISWIARSRPASRSSSGTTPRACITGRI